MAKIVFHYLRQGAECVNLVVPTSFLLWHFCPIIDCWAANNAALFVSPTLKAYSLLPVFLGWRRLCIVCSPFSWNSACCVDFIQFDLILNEELVLYSVVQKVDWVINISPYHTLKTKEREESHAWNKAGNESSQLQVIQSRNY